MLLQRSKDKPIVFPAELEVIDRCFRFNVGVYFRGVGVPELDDLLIAGDYLVLVELDLLDFLSILMSEHFVWLLFSHIVEKDLSLLSAHGHHELIFLESNATDFFLGVWLRREGEDFPFGAEVPELY